MRFVVSPLAVLSALSVGCFPVPGSPKKDSEPSQAPSGGGGSGDFMSQFDWAALRALSLPRIAGNAGAGLALLDEPIRSSDACTLRSRGKSVIESTLEKIPERFCDGSEIELGVLYEMRYESGLRGRFVARRLSDTQVAWLECSATSQPLSSTSVTFGREGRGKVETTYFTMPQYHFVLDKQLTEPDTYELVSLWGNLPGAATPYFGGGDTWDFFALSVDGAGLGKFEAAYMSGATSQRSYVQLAPTLGFAVSSDADSVVDAVLRRSFFNADGYLVGGVEARALAGAELPDLRESLLLRPGDPRIVFPPLNEALACAGDVRIVDLSSCSEAQPDIASDSNECASEAPAAGSFERPFATDGTLELRRSYAQDGGEILLYAGDVVGLALVAHFVDGSEVDATLQAIWTPVGVELVEAESCEDVTTEGAIISARGAATALAERCKLRETYPLLVRAREPAGHIELTFGGETVTIRADAQPPELLRVIAIPYVPGVAAACADVEPWNGAPVQPIYQEDRTIDDGDTIQLSIVACWSDGARFVSGSDVALSINADAPYSTTVLTDPEGVVELVAPASGFEVSGTLELTYENFLTLYEYKTVQ